MFKLALAQMRVVGGRAEENRHHAESFIQRAADAGAAVVLLPEALDFGWTHSSARDGAGPIPGGATCERLRECARHHRIFVCAGLVERDGDGLFNSAILADPQGALLLHHRKLNELDIAHGVYAQGDRLAVARTALGTIGVMICADAFARGQVVSRSLALMGADVILSPCAWAMPAGHDNVREPYGLLWLDSYGPVARDFSVWIAGCSNVGQLDDGPWAGRECIGNSLVIAPDGSVAARGPFGVDAESLLLVDVAPVPRPARGDGWEKVWLKRGA